MTLGKASVWSACIQAVVQVQGEPLHYSLSGFNKWYMTTNALDQGNVLRVTPAAITAAIVDGSHLAVGKVQS